MMKSNRWQSQMTTVFLPSLCTRMKVKKNAEYLPTTPLSPQRLELVGHFVCLLPAYGDDSPAALDLPLATVLLELPVSVVEGADGSGLEPSRDAVEVKGVVTYSPRDCALLTCGRGLVRLTLNTEIHDVVSADGTVVDDNVPSPKGDSVPLLDLEVLLALDSTIGLLSDGGRSVSHLDVGHCGWCLPRCWWAVKVGYAFAFRGGGDGDGDGDGDECSC